MAYLTFVLRSDFIPMALPELRLRLSIRDDIHLRLIGWEDRRDARPVLLHKPREWDHLFHTSQVVESIVAILARTSNKGMVALFVESGLLGLKIESPHSKQGLDLPDRAGIPDPSFEDGVRDLADSETGHLRTSSECTPHQIHIGLSQVRACFR